MGKPSRNPRDNIKTGTANRSKTHSSSVRAQEKLGNHGSCFGKIMSSTSFLTEESNDSGLGDFTVPSLYDSSNFSIFQDEDANHTGINSVFADAAVNSSSRTVFSLKCFNEEVKNNFSVSSCEGNLSTNKQNTGREPENGFYQIVDSSKRKVPLKCRASVEPVSKRQRKSSAVDQSSRKRNQPLIGLVDASLGHDAEESQENIPMKSNNVDDSVSRSPNVAADCGPASKVKARRSILCGNYSSVSRNGIARLEIINQPEIQHRARYLTEGSRGAVKDQSGRGFPEIKLFGYNKAATLQVFVGNEAGKVQPHLFYQVCKVCGKHSAPCTERKIDGTVVLEYYLQPESDMSFSCDCVGILKERNVDVEKRLAICSGYTNKKKCTKCRLIFRVSIQSPGSPSGVEILQIASSPMSCTQPPGIPEITKKSLSEYSVNGKVELFIIGKHFLKDTKVVFEGQQRNGNTGDTWKVSVDPDKDYLQHNHMICEVPPYQHQAISSPVKVHLMVVSGGKISEPHIFTYKPLCKLGMPTLNQSSMITAKPVTSSSCDTDSSSMVRSTDSIDNFLNVAEVTPPSFLDPNQVLQSPVLSAVKGTSTTTTTLPASSPSSSGPLPTDHRNLNCEVKSVVSLQNGAPIVISNKPSSPVLVQPGQLHLNLVQPSHVIQATPVSSLVLSRSPTLIIQPSTVVHTPSKDKRGIANIASTNVCGLPTGSSTSVTESPISSSMPVLSKFISLPVNTLVKSANTVQKKTFGLQLRFVQNINNASVLQSPSPELLSNIVTLPNLVLPSANGVKNQNLISVQPNVTLKLMNTITGHVKPIAGLPAEGFLDEIFPQVANKLDTSVAKVSQPVEIPQVKQKDFSEHVHMMTEFSELPEADLIKLINPSTFDNV